MVQMAAVTSALACFVATGAGAQVKLKRIVKTVKEFDPKTEGPIPLSKTQKSGLATVLNPDADKTRSSGDLLTETGQHAKCGRTFDEGGAFVIEYGSGAKSDTSIVTFGP